MVFSDLLSIIHPSFSTDLFPPANPQSCLFPPSNHLYPPVLISTAAPTRKLTFFFYYVSLRDQAQVVRFGGQNLYPLSCTVSSVSFSYKRARTEL